MASQTARRTTGQRRLKDSPSSGGVQDSQSSTMLPRPKPHDTLAVLYFGASHIVGGIYMLPDGEYCLGDGSLYGQQPIDEYHGRWECWRCGGVGRLKRYIGNRYLLVTCDECNGSRQSGLMPELQPRHLHEWRPSEEDGCPARFEPMRCKCGALWLKKRERAVDPRRIGGLLPIGALLGKEIPHGRQEPR